MLSSLTLAVIILLLAASGSAVLLVRDVNASHLRERIGVVRYRTDDQAPAGPLPSLGIRSPDDHSNLSKRLMHVLRLNPDNPQQNVLAWKVVIAIACAVGLAGFFYGRAFVGLPLAALTVPVETFLVARVIFGWERARYQKAVLEQLPDVMALICRAVGAGIPLSEALRSVVTDAPTPSHEAFVHVISGLAIGQRLEDALWKLYERVGLSEYAFFAVTISLQAQTGGSLVETLQNLQDIVRKRVQLSKRGRAMAAEARSSAMILGALPFVLGLILSHMQPGFLNFFFSTPSGNHLLLAALGLLGTGILVMRQLIRRSLAP
jgi:tight adherence protein B